MSRENQDIRPFPGIRLSIQFGLNRAEGQKPIDLAARIEPPPPPETDDPPPVVLLELQKDRRPITFGRIHHTYVTN